MATGATENVLLLSTISILQIIKEAQQQHGLRHDNYQRYRSYCARKLRRIRKSLHITNTHRQKSFQQKKFSHENVANDSRFLLICLFEAERCWAHSEQLRQEAGNEPQSRKLFQAINKLRRAVRHSQTLEDLCRIEESSVDAATKLEAQAYNAWLQGCLNISLKDYKGATTNLNTAKTIYDKLSNASTGSMERSIYQERYQELIAPQLRLCYSNLNEALPNDFVESMASADIDKLIAQTREKQQLEESKSEIVWCNFRINISKASAKVKSFVSSLKQFDELVEQASNTDSKTTLYEQLLGDCRDAMQAIRDEFKDENFKLKRDTNENQIDDLSEQQTLYFWLSSIRLTKTVEKYLGLICSQRKQNLSDRNIEEVATNNSSILKSNKPQDMVRLYDAVLQNLNDLLATPGINRDKNYVATIERQIAYFATFRCYYVAETFDMQKKWRESLSLYQRGLEHSANVRQLISKVKVGTAYASFLHVDTDLLNDLVNALQTAKYTAHANCLVEDNGQGSNTSTDKKLLEEKLYIEDLTTYRRLNPQDIVGSKKTTFVTRMPPDFRPMPCKPLFFDLALNHLTFPSLESKMDVADSSKHSQKIKQNVNSANENKGIGGLMKGWFWGGKS